MSDMEVKVGKILIDREKETRSRVIEVCNEEIVLCRLDTSKIILERFLPDTVMKLLIDERFAVTEDEEPIFDPETLPERDKKTFKQYTGMMDDVRRVFGPSYLALKSRGMKDDREEIIEKYRVSPGTFWNVCRRYLQSGFRISSLLDGRIFAGNTGMTYQYSKKAGPKPKHFKNVGVVLTDEVRRNMADGLKHFQENKSGSVRDAYLWMCRTYYRQQGMQDGSFMSILLPEDERPTLRQFEHYVNTHMTKEEKDERKTSRAEVRNSKRLTTKDTKLDAGGPGQLACVDEEEVDLSLVSLVDHGQAVGRAVVYFLVDEFSSIILAVSVSFDNNSIMGITNLLLNLQEDKQEFGKRYNYSFKSPKDWPSGILPERIRADRGSEYRSYEFMRICNDLDISLQLVPGATGSYKGTIEQAFRQMNATLDEHVEGKGLITKDHDSKHHQHAVMDIEDYTETVLTFIDKHNHQYMEKYPRTKDMREKKVRPVPVELWDYGIKYLNTPRPITDEKMYKWTLMTTDTATLSRAGLNYHGRWYMPIDDPQIHDEMYALGEGSKKIDIRIDKRCADAIYYMRDHRLIQAPLNPDKAGNLDYKGYTLAAWDKVNEQQLDDNAHGRVYNEELDAFAQEANEITIENVKKRKGPANTKNMREAREIDKQMVDASKKMFDSPVDDEGPKEIEEDALPEEEPLLEEEEEEEFDRAFEVFKDKEHEN